MKNTPYNPTFNLVHLIYNNEGFRTGAINLILKYKEELINNFGDYFDENGNIIIVDQSIECSELKDIFGNDKDFKSLRAILTSQWRINNSIVTSLKGSGNTVSFDHLFSQNREITPFTIDHMIVNIGDYGLIYKALKCSAFTRIKTNHRNIRIFLNKVGKIKMHDNSTKLLGYLMIDRLDPSELENTKLVIDEYLKKNQQNTLANELKEYLIK